MNISQDHGTCTKYMFIWVWIECQRNAWASISAYIVHVCSVSCFFYACPNGEKRILASAEMCDACGNFSVWNAKNTIHSRRGSSSEWLPTSKNSQTFAKTSPEPSQIRGATILISRVYLSCLQAYIIKCAMAMCVLVQMWCNVRMGRHSHTFRKYFWAYSHHFQITKAAKAVLLLSTTFTASFAPIKFHLCPIPYNIPFHSLLCLCFISFIRNDYKIFSGTCCLCQFENRAKPMGKCVCSRAYK